MFGLLIRKIYSLGNVDTLNRKYLTNFIVYLED